MLIDFPRYTSLEEYEKAIDEMVDLLKTFDGAHTIFQVGGLSSPGISDIDFFVVFEDGVICNREPLNEISPKARYLFTHSLFGTAKKYAAQLEQYTLFRNYRKLWGEDFDVTEQYQDPDDTMLTQMALEYLFKMYLTLQIESKNGIHGVRNFLLLAKAIEYDLKLLNISEGSLYDLCNEVLALRDRWFEDKIEKMQIEQFIPRFKSGVGQFLSDQLAHNTFYLPKVFNHKIARNMQIANGDCLKTTIKGVAPFPAFGTALMGKKYPKLLNRLVDFTFHIPYSQDDIPKRINDRFEALREAAAYNKEYLSHFSCTGYPLNIF